MSTSANAPGPEHARLDETLDDEQARSKIQFGCALAAAGVIALALLVLAGLLYLFFVGLGQVRIAD